MKTSIFKIIIIAVILITYTGCGEDFLTLQNPNELTNDNFFKTRDHAYQGMVACYDILHSNGFVGGKDYLYMTYAADPNCVVERPDMENFIFDASVGFSGAVYMYLYRGLYRTNTLIHRIAEVDDPEFTDKERELMLAEAKALRALYNFYLVVHFNEPPFIDTIISEVPTIVGNSPQEDFWNSIEEDCIDAIEVLPESWPDQWVGRVTWGAAKAFLGKAYLYQQKWEEARQQFLDIIESGIYQLSMPQGTDSADFVNAYMCNFTYEDIQYKDRIYRAENNMESVFEIQNGNDDRQWNKWLPGWGINGSQASAYFAAHGWRNAAVTPEYGDNVFENVEGEHPGGLVFDPRRTGTIFAPGDTITFDLENEFFGDRVAFNPSLHANPAITKKYGLRKFYYPIHTYNSLAPFNDPNNWRLIRYADILLMYAEADYHVNGSGGDGLNRLNEVRARAGMPAISELTPQAIMHEREVELGCEVFGYIDLVRWSRVGDEWVAQEDLPDLMDGFIVGKNEYWPIPINEINKMNGELRQNPNW